MVDNRLADIITAIEDSKNSKTLAVRVGEVLTADPIRKFYLIASDKSLNDGVLDIQGVPIESVLASSRPVAVPAYKAGDMVLYVEELNVSREATVERVIILGAALGRYFDSNINLKVREGKLLDSLYQASEFQDIGLYKELNPDSEQYATIRRKIPTWRTEDIWKLIAERRGYPETDEQLSFARGNSPSDLFQGNYSIQGLESNVIVGDHYLNLTAKKATIKLNSIFSSITSCSLFNNNYTLSREEANFIKRKNLIEQKLVGATTETFYDEFDIKNPPLPFYFTRISLYDFGKTSSIMDMEQRPITGVEQLLNGRVEVTSKNGVSLQKKIKVPYFKLIDRRPGAAPDYDPEGINKRDDIIKNVLIPDTETWEKHEHAGGNSDSVFGSPGKSEDISVEHMTDEFETAGKMTTLYNEGEAGIHILPSGGILIRDAWGSEIRMEGGNVQITAANNLIKVAGRDSINIASGVHVVNAGEAIQLGAANQNIEMTAGKNVLINAAEEANVTCKKTITIATDGGRVGVISHDIYMTAEKGDCVIRSNTGVISMAASAIKAYSAYSLALCTPRSAMLMNNGYLTMAAPSCNISGYVIGLGGSGSISLESVLNNQGNVVSIKVPQKKCVLDVMGCVRVGENLQVGESISAKGSVACNLVAHFNKSPFVGTLKTAPKDVKISSSGGSDGILAVVSKELYENFKALSFKNLLNRIFKIASKACSIFETKGCAKAGKSSITPVTVDIEGSKQYIYPGKKFWTINGLISYDAEFEKESMLDPNEYPQKYKYKGASVLSLNTENTIAVDSGASGASAPASNTRNTTGIE